ncbi:MAG: hypothetical protein RSE16_07340 [Sphingobium sp.]|nr:MAG: hypothetical protein RSE16_07340 [Sphingobium sp.]
MNRPARVRGLFAEITGSLGPAITAYEALRLASHLIEVADGLDHGLSDQFREQRAAFYEQPVDKVLNSGQWQIMKYERDFVAESYDDDAGLYQESNALKQIQWSW